MRTNAAERLVAYESGVCIPRDSRADPESLKPPMPSKTEGPDDDGDGADDVHVQPPPGLGLVIELAQAREEVTMLQEELAGARSRLSEARVLIEEAERRTAAWDAAKRLLTDLREVVATLERIELRQREERPTVTPAPLDISALMRSVEGS